jgi:hypothetical protein
VHSPRTITIRPAAGPLIVSGAPVIAVVIRPPTIAVSRPATGGNPLATAIPRQSGRANIETKKPLNRFDLILARENIRHFFFLPDLIWVI